MQVFTVARGLSLAVVGVGLLSSCRLRFSHCSGSLIAERMAPGAQASVAVAHGF